MTRGYLDQRLFLRVIELGSLRAVAREADLEASSVSRRLTRLESRLGVRLLERGTGATEPTEAGRQYYEALRRLLAQIDMLEAGIARQPERLKGLLRVAAPADFGRAHVAAWLLSFRARHPGLEIDLVLGDPAPAPDQTGADLVLTCDPVARRLGLGRQKLAECRQMLVAAPGYLSRHGAPREAADLVGHQHVFRHRSEMTAPLRLTGRDGRRHSIRRNGALSLGALSTAVEAACGGEGVLFGPVWALAPALDRGALVPVLADHRFDMAPLTALWSEAEVLPGRIPGFVAHALSQVRQVPGTEDWG
ncbi:LysR family transcriptional regulator [Fluviibacterium sp. DFM31]|uniref:LysR family transcriptional regulator n=1 Tax=Meridianimarinicoccus marinus TaxID=3231483 RepID=A0ABV3L1G5_9RHOB